jgi:hypothetical protein
MWIAGGFVVLFLLDRGFSTVMLPFAWRAQWKARKQTRDLMIAMAHAYGELNGQDQVSRRRLREVTAKTAVFWIGFAVAEFRTHWAPGCCLAGRRFIFRTDRTSRTLT